MPRNIVVILRLVLMYCSVVIALSACGGSSSGDSSNNEPINEDIVGDSESIGPMDDALPPGDVGMFGAITIADDAGIASDIIGSFFAFDTPVSGSELAKQLTATQARCVVEADEISGFSDISASFFPSIPGAGRAISAGNPILLTADMGDYAVLQQEGVTDFRFYGVESVADIPAGPVPEPLNAFVPGDEFPQFENKSFPPQTTLTNVSFSDAPSVLPTTQFSWEATADSKAIVRLFSNTAGGFFLENSIKVNCLVPDTGTFEFPPAIQAALGADFVGGSPIISRLSANVYVENDAALMLIRESFAE